MAGLGPKPQTQASTSFALLQSELPQILAGSPQRTGSSPGLHFPAAHIRSEGPLVWQFSRLPSFRLQGLATLLTVYSLRIPAGVLASRSARGIHPFQAPALQSSAAFSQRRPHMLFHLHLMARSKLEATVVPASASGTATSQHAPSPCTHITEVPGRQAACLGFSSLGSTASQTLNPPSRIILPRAQKSRAFTRNSTHLGVSIGLRLTGLGPPAIGGTKPATLLRFLHQSGPQH